MRVWSSIVNIIGVVFLAFLLLMFYNMDNIIDKQFEEMRLRYALDYATEAAFMSTLEVYDIGIDYDDMEAVNINPSYCLDTFKTLICMSYDMSLSDENFSMLENYIPVAVLMCNDGFYVAQMKEVDDRQDNISGGNYELRWNMKKPYAYKKDMTSTVTEANPLYSFNLHSDKWTSVFPKDGSIRIQHGESLPEGISRDDISRGITNRVTEEMNCVIRERNKLNNSKSKSVDSVFYLPSNLTASGINTIDRPALLIMMQNVDFAGKGETINAISLGGVKTERKKVVVGFIEDGVMYYCYEKQLPENKLDLVIDFYDDVEEAADAGYYPHYIYLSKPNREREQVGGNQP